MLLPQASVLRPYGEHRPVPHELEFMPGMALYESGSSGRVVPWGRRRLAATSQFWAPSALQPPRAGDRGASPRGEVPPPASIPEGASTDGSSCGRMSAAGFSGVGGAVCGYRPLCRWVSGARGCRPEPMVSPLRKGAGLCTFRSHEKPHFFHRFGDQKDISCAEEDSGLGPASTLTINSSFTPNCVPAGVVKTIILISFRKRPCLRPLPTL